MNQRESDRERKGEKSGQVCKNRCIMTLRIGEGREEGRKERRKRGRREERNEETALVVVMLVSM